VGSELSYDPQHEYYSTWLEFINHGVSPREWKYYARTRSSSRSCVSLLLNPLNTIEKEADPVDPLTHQEGGSHYKNKAIQPIEYIMANGLGFCEGNVVKYVTRYKDKNGIEDLKKARHYIDFLIEDQERSMNIQEGTHG
jgi:hypothetical protein